MSLKAELETQAAALKAYDEQNFEQALEIYGTIAETSKIHTNIGLIYATLGEHEYAVDAFNAATELDQYLAVAYFQCGVSNFLLGRFEYSLKDFEEALLYLRGNQDINYEQLGLKYVLYSAEVKFNKGLCRIYLGDAVGGMRDLRESSTEKVTAGHNVIDEAIRDEGREYTVFSIPVGVLFRPSETKLKNAKAKDYLGKAKLISATDANDAFTTFTGVTRFNQGLLPSGAPLSELNRTGSTSTMNSGVTARSAPGDLGAGGAGGGLGRSATAAARMQRGGSVDMGRMNDLPPILPLKTSDGKDRPSNLGRSATFAGSVTPGEGMGGPKRNPSFRYQRKEQFPTNAVQDQSPTLSRQMTQLNMRDRDTRLQPPRSPQDERDASVRRSPSKPTAPRENMARLTEIYDDYLGSDEPEPPLPPGASRVAAWANKTAPGAPAPPSRSQSTMGGAKPAPSAYSGSNLISAGGTLRRKLTRKMSGSISRLRGTSLVYDDEEEGYVSGDYEDTQYELAKIRVKIHYEDEMRGMTLTPDIGFQEFFNKVAAKFGRSTSSVKLKFKDEDGAKVTLLDESDYDLALETARESAKGKPEGRLEVWCE